MDVVAAEFWASVVGALVGGLLAAGTAFALFIAERKSARAARDEEVARDVERAEAERQARDLENRESLLDSVEAVLLGIWVDDAEPGRAAAPLRELKTVTRRASAVVSRTDPGASEWLGKLYWAAALRVAAYVLIAMKSEKQRTPGDHMAGPAYNGWMNTQLDRLVAWRLGEVSDQEMLEAASSLAPLNKDNRTTSDPE